MDPLDEPRSPEWKATIERLDAAYSVGGRAALAAMEGVEPLALWNEKVRDYKILGKRLEAEPGDRAAGMQREKLLREINDIGGWINGKLREQNRAARSFSLDDRRREAAKQPTRQRNIELERD